MWMSQVQTKQEENERILAMTKKHFVALAAALKSVKPRITTTTDHQQWVLTVNAILNFCQSQNAQFDRERFLAACGVTK